MRHLLGLALAWLLAGTAVLDGCGLPAAAPTAERSLAITPVWAQRRILALVSPYTKRDVATLLITLSTRAGETETKVAERALANGELDGTVVFERLRPFTAYRVRGFAFAADGALISLDAASFADLTLTDDDAPVLTHLTVTLRDTPFNGQASSGPIAITDGALIPAP